MLSPAKTIASSSNFNIQDGLRAQMTQDPIKVDAKKVIGNSKFPVYLAINPTNRKQYAMKMFHYKDDKICENYKNESRFVNLSHPNMISIVQAIDHKRTMVKNEIKHSSYILMELAISDIASLLETTSLFTDEQLLRTYFLQAVNGIEFLHSKGIYHLDIKPENLLLGYDFILKISDFDTSYFLKDPYVRSAGTINYRAPELQRGSDVVPKMADSYSLGICLFVLKVGYLPYKENVCEKGNDLAGMLFEDVNMFWETHENLNPLIRQLDDEFKDLFVKLTRKNSLERLTISQIRGHKWSRGCVYKNDELREILKEKIDVL